MALIVGVERGFITRGEALTRLHTITRFLGEAERFHGVWPHFLDGRTGKGVPLFGPYDNGGDLLETAFLIQGLLTARQYFSGDSPAERELRATITELWGNGRVGLVPENARERFSLLALVARPRLAYQPPPHRLERKTMIAYLLAVASPTHAVAALRSTTAAGLHRPKRRSANRQNWGKTTEGERYRNGTHYYGLELPVGVGSGGPLFFTHYSFLGFDPRHKRDAFTNYFQNNRVLSLINYRLLRRESGRL